jgi:stearoyl-CoA desaturase (delta-9 desaturase)
MSPNFAARWWEIDTTYQVMKVLNFVGIIDMSKAQKMRAPTPEDVEAARTVEA